MKAILSVLSAIALLASPAFASESVTIAYPTTDDASFLITAPEDWELDPAEEPDGYFDLTGPTGAVFSFRTIKGTESALEQAIKESVEEANDMFADVQLGEAMDWTPDGLEGFYAVGDAKDKEDGTPIRIGMAWCALKDGRIAEMWFSAEAADTEGLEAANKIANSLRSP